MNQIKGEGMNIIEQKVNLSSLGESIAFYINRYGKNPRFCVMSTKTCRAIKTYTSIQLQTTLDSNLSPRIFGMPIAFCEELDYGEVEVVG